MPITPYGSNSATRQNGLAFRKSFAFISSAATVARPIASDQVPSSNPGSNGNVLPMHLSEGCRAGFALLSVDHVRAFDHSWQSCSGNKPSRGSQMFGAVASWVEAVVRRPMLLLMLDCSEAWCLDDLLPISTPPAHPTASRQDVPFDCGLWGTRQIAKDNRLAHVPNSVLFLTFAFCALTFSLRRLPCPHLRRCSPASPMLGSGGSDFHTL